ncbi:MAG: DUF1735 domain-containing protein [Mediterranea sp.]|jgi:hypothetical protein|nr:DUF1735 domain-containing protein [Mediterranea sp.]
MKIKVLLLAGCSVFPGACNDSDYDLDKLVPEEYRKILYVNNSGKQELTLFDTDEDNKYALSVVKSGSEPNRTAGANIHVLTQAELDDRYGIPEEVNYKRIDEDCYVLQTRNLEFSLTDRYKIVEISLKPQKVKASIESDPSAVWTLPLRVVSETDSINAERNDLILLLKEVIMPALGFVGASAELKNYNYGEIPDISEKIAIGLDMDNKWELEWELEVYNDYVAAYNAANNTVFRTLPQDSYTIPETMQLTNGTTTTQFTANINGGRLEPGDYMLPIRIRNVSLFEISSTHDIYPLAIRILGNKLDRTGWTAEANTQESGGEGAGNGIPGCILDDNLSTYWHSSWSSGNHSLPHELIIDAKEEYSFTHIAMAQRQHDNYKDTRAGKFHVSPDKENWTEAGSFVMEKVFEPQMYGITPARGRYIKIQILESYRDLNCSLSEVYVYGLK